MVKRLKQFSTRLQRKHHLVLSLNCHEAHVFFVLPIVHRSGQAEMTDGLSGSKLQEIFSLSGGRKILTGLTYLEGQPTITWVDHTPKYIVKILA